jgi:hypothetical protein
MATMAEWSRKGNWRNWLTRTRTCCAICYHFGDALGNPPDHAVVVVSGKREVVAATKDGKRHSLREARDLFKRHVKTHHEPEWLNDRLEWSIRS